MFSPHARGWPVDAIPIGWFSLCSPRTRGDGPQTLTGILVRPAVLPARAGMARSWHARYGAADRFSPHARGWPAAVQSIHLYLGWFSPHARGWPSGHRPQPYSHRRSPRTRGDGPSDALPRQQAAVRSPRTRGDGPADIAGSVRRQSVLLARAGMARRSRALRAASGWFSPHARGWPADPPTQVGSLGVLPARAGMARNQHPSGNEFHSSPRTRGDGP